MDRLPLLFRPCPYSSSPLEAFVRNLMFSERVLSKKIGKEGDFKDLRKSKVEKSMEKPKRSEFGTFLVFCASIEVKTAISTTKVSEIVGTRRKTAR